MRTPPFPGPGIGSLRDIDNDPHTEDSVPQAVGSGIGIGLLFGSQAQVQNEPSSLHQSRSMTQGKGKGKGRAAKSRIPNPYAPSSSESEEELEPPLEEVDTIRRSLIRPSPGPSKMKQPVSDRAKKGWLAHQSIFPPSSSSSSETEESEKETEEDSDNERAGMMGRSRKVQSKSKSRNNNRNDEEDEEEVDGYILSPSELHRANAIGQVDRENMEEPLLGPDELDQTRRGTGGGKVPVRLQVYHGRFGHWEREGLRKYKDSGFLALWLTSIIGVVFGLFFVWGSTDVSIAHFSRRVVDMADPV